MTHDSFSELELIPIIPNLHRHAVAGGVHVRRDEPLGRAEEVGELALVGDGLVDRVLGVHRLVVRLLLLPLKRIRVHAWFTSPFHRPHLRDEDDDPAGALAARPAHPLDEADGRLGDVVAHDQVHLADVQALQELVLGRIIISLRINQELTSSPTHVATSVL